MNPEKVNGASPWAFWALLSRAEADTVSIPRGASALWLDPVRTSPNVVLGVAGKGFGVQYMRPGDTIKLDGSGSPVRVWNPWKAPPAYAGSLYPGRVGFIGLTALSPAEEATIALRPKRNHASIILAVGLRASSVVSVRTDNLTGVRFTLIPLNPGKTGLYGVSPPADFAATLTPGVAAFGVGTNTGAWFTGLATAEESLPIAHFEDDSQSYGNIGDASDMAMQASQTQIVFDREVVCPGQMRLKVSGIAGTGIALDAIGLIVEGR